MFTKRAIKKILNDLAASEISSREAYNRLKGLPYADLGFAKVDCHRLIRRDFPEIIYAEGKKAKQIKEIAKKIQKNGAVIVTRASKAVYAQLVKSFPRLCYNEAARIIYPVQNRHSSKKGLVLVITAGTSDIPIAEEAKVTLEVMGNRVRCLYDVGVAGIHRIIDKRKLLDQAKVIIVIAGMEGALASVVSGLVSKPVIAVPTSVGYGASFKGIAPLLTMLNSCSPGVAVVNIDNGFGAGYLASLINK